MVIGTAGHIDHGKSALVEALTGTHPDRLPEEKRRGMTLDLGFGHLPLATLDGEIQAGIVDVPGHENFIRTMLAGASGVDVALLVVAADAGVQPQSREHLDICLRLGIARGVIAITKCDLASPAQLASVREQIATLLGSTRWAGCIPIATSAHSGAGLDELRRALAQAAQSLPARDLAAPFRLPVDRAFTLKGFGTVATGTLIEGTLSATSAVSLVGSARPLRLRGLHAYGRPVEAACAGQRVALNLAGVESADLPRGTVVAEPGVFGLTLELDVQFENADGVDWPRHRARVHFYLHAAERVATLLWLAPPRAGAAWAQLRLDEAVAAVPGDRFLLRQLSPALTLGGGRVLDTAPPRHRPADYPAVAAFLAELAGAAAADGLALRLRRAGRAGLGVAALARALGRRSSELQAELDHSAAAGRVVLSAHPPAVLAASAMAELEAEILLRLDAFHARQPLQPAATPEALALTAPPRWIAAALARLQAAGAIESEAGVGNRYRRAGRGVALDGAQQALRDRLAAHFRAAGLAIPPLAEALAAFPQPEARPLLQSLLRQGALLQLRPGLVLDAEAWRQLRQMLAQRRASRARFSVADFKQWTALSRKYAIPLLEELDRQRLTRRVGELREIL